MSDPPTLFHTPALLFAPLARFFGRCVWLISRRFRLYASIIGVFLSHVEAFCFNDEAIGSGAGGLSVRYCPNFIQG
ncbi:MAG: hypothetical protein KZQ75_04295 [Candidatus Thiodiazotropha sp. (ex Myrtea spinifera)]|nr:hypothetical protein [Candidatus Thiodiazotropha sp. (ex Myrtea spinifera)]MCU7829758.1 hypothetical protein [Candidatus Thiodiazotropha sp. (ex Myrtea sp. 'scaly one' KF741663)]